MKRNNVLNPQVILIIVIILSAALTPDLLFSEEVSSSVAIKPTGKKLSLDENKTGIVLMPSAYNRELSSKGLNIDFLLTNVVGEIYGTRAGSPDKEWTNPIIMSIVTFNFKYIFKTETLRLPSMSIGGMSSLALDLGGGQISAGERPEYEKIERPKIFFGYYFVTGKNIWLKHNWLVNLGYLSNSYAKGFSNFAPYYFSNSAHSVYAGLDLNFLKDKGCYLECIKPFDSQQNPMLINLRIKNFLIPTLSFFYIKTDEGSSVMAVINFRVSLYPPFTKEELLDKEAKQREKEKRRQWNEKLKNIQFD